MAIRTIIAALALEADDDPVAARAIQLARRHGAQLIFVHVVEDVLSFDVGLPAPVEAPVLWRLVEQAATERMKKLMEHSGLEKTPESFVATGSPFAVIREMAEYRDADLIITGQGKKKNIKDRVFGSTADRVVRLSPCPVLVVKSPDSHAYERVSVAVDFSEPSRAALKAAMDIAPDAVLTILHVVDIPFAFEQAMFRAGADQKEISRYRQAKTVSVRKELRESLAEAGFSGISDKLRAFSGYPAEMLARHARSGRADLFALGTQGRNPVSQALLGSVAKRVLQVTLCDVLVTPNRPPAKES